jgi:hypothetical protein
MSTIINATTTNGVVIQPDNSGSLVLQTNSGTTALTIDTSQNVGIGTASPSVRLHLKGSSFANAIRWEETGGNNNFYAGPFDTSGNFGIDNNSSTGYTRFATNSTERMRIDSSGNVLVGVSSIPFNTAKLFVGTAATRGCYLYSTSAGDVGTEQLRIGKYDNNTTTSQIFVRFTVNNDSNGSGQINANGASACAFGSYSDISLKENIEPLPSQLDNIMALKPSEFDFKDGSGHQIGFIAQDMQEVYPDVVSPDENGLLMVTGWSKTEARLVKAIQEQQTIINDLKARVETLEGAK